MFLALSAIAMTLGTALTIHDLATEPTSVQAPAAVVEVAPIQVQETQKIEIETAR